MSSEAKKELCRSKAVEAWAKPSTSGIVMDVTLAEAFTEIIEEIWSQPWLGNATTRQLIDELSARIEVDGAMEYRPVDDPVDGDLDEGTQTRKALKGEMEFLEDCEEDLGDEEPDVYEEKIYDD